MSALRIKQTTQDGRTKTWKIASKSLQTFGSARKADMVSIDRLSPKYEAALEHREDGWHFVTFSAKDQTPDVKLNPESKIKLSESELQFAFIDKEEFVQSSLNNMKASGTEKRKILMVSRDGKLLKTEVRHPTHQFTYSINGQKHNLPFPGSEQWQDHQIDGFHFRSKLIMVEDAKKFGHVTSDQLVDKESKKMLVLTLGAMALLVFMGLVAPKSQPQISQEPPKTPMNVIVKMDKKKEKPKPKSSAPAVQAPSAPTQAAAAPASGGKVNSLLKGAVGARISQLIGKVSATEARTANVLVTTTGIKAGQGDSGRALAAVGNVNTSGRNWDGESAAGTKAGVSTGGIGGGKGAAGMGSGLQAGKTGSGGVGLIEEESEVEGGLDREIIAQYIKTQLGQILYCYERQLSASPELYGKVAVKFVITGSGQVESQSIGDTTLKNQPVEGCILSKISKWKFPEPKGGTKVVVTYPFLFKSTN